MRRDSYESQVGIAVRLDPVGMLDVQGVVDLLLESNVKSAFRQTCQSFGKVSKCARCGATFTLERTRGTFRTLAISVSALFHFNFDSF